MRKPTLLSGTAAALILLGVAGCGGGKSAGSTVNPNGTEVSPAGDIPDDQAYVAYRPPSGGHTVKVPEGWARTTAGGAVAFTDKLNRIRMESGTRGTALTVAAVRKTSGGLRAAKVSAVRRKAGSWPGSTIRRSGASTGPRSARAASCAPARLPSSSRVRA